MLDELARRTDKISRSVSPENCTGAKGAGGRAAEGTGAQAAGEPGRGWKISPGVEIAPGATAEPADIDGPGTVRHIWCTTAPHRAWVGTRAWRGTLLRAYWDGAAQQAVK